MNNDQLKSLICSNLIMLFERLESINERLKDLDNEDNKHQKEEFN